MKKLTIVNCSRNPKMFEDVYFFLRKLKAEIKKNQVNFFSVFFCVFFLSNCQLVMIYFIFNQISLLSICMCIYVYIYIDNLFLSVTK